MKLFPFPIRRAFAITLAWLLAGPVLALAQTNLPHAQVGVAYNFQVSTTPAAPAGCVYGAVGLPTGLSINASSGRTSTSTGVAPARLTPSAVAMNVKAGTITSSPGPIPNAR